MATAYSKSATSVMQLFNFSAAWFALQVKQGHEKCVALILSHKGYEHFLPVQSVRRRWSDRTKKIELPLFPGYLFCRFDAAIGAPLVTTPGVIRIVGAGKTPLPVDDQEIEALQALVQSGLEARPCEFLSVGQRVTVETGPLSGLEGLVLTVKNQYRLILSIALLQRSVAVEVDADWLRPCNTPALPSSWRR